MRLKLLIVGLDGATWDVLDPLLSTGRLPTLSRLIQRGGRHTLRSTVPPISSAAWVTMMTGANPGRHGVFDFRNLNMHRYSAHDERLANARSYSLPTLFDYLGQAGLSSLAYGVPMTYPPWDIRGMMVAGYPTPDHRRAYTTPPDLADKLGRLFTHSPDQIGSASPPEQKEIYLRYMHSMTDQLLMLADAGHDVMMFVNGATDGAQHRFFKYAIAGFPGVSDQERAEHGHLLADIMIASDAELGRLLEAFVEPLNILVISDHGGMPRPTRAFNLNAWLAAAGWLVRRDNVAAAGKRRAQQLTEWAKQSLPITDWVKKRLPNRIKRQVTSLRSGLGNIEWAQTSAYRVKLSHPIEGIHLNMQGRQPEGIVPPTSYTQMREQIIALLNERPEIMWAHPREEIYSGDHLENAPDILVRLQPEFDGGADLDQTLTTIPTGWLQSVSGYHTMDGILITAGPDFLSSPISPLSPPALQDITPTILHLLKLPVPAEMDGRVLHELMTTARPVQVGDSLARDASISDALSEEEEAGIANALRDLGYIE